MLISILLRLESHIDFYLYSIAFSLMRIWSSIRTRTQLKQDEKKKKKERRKMVQYNWVCLLLSIHSVGFSRLRAFPSAPVPFSLHAYRLPTKCLFSLIDVSVAYSTPSSRHNAVYSSWSAHNTEDINQNVCILLLTLWISPSFSHSSLLLHICREEMRKELEIKFKKLMKERNEWYVCTHSVHTAQAHTHKLPSFFHFPCSSCSSTHTYTHTHAFCHIDIG